VRYVAHPMDMTDTPEVIWKYTMRGHAVDMVASHLGDLRQRLASHARTLYDYCPIPRIIFEELAEELWYV
jgi:DnaJ homolog subfamily C member 13